MSKFKTIGKFLLTGLLCAGATGCGSTTFDNVITTNNGQPGFVVTEPATIQRNGDVVDTIELEAFDAQGNRLPLGNVLAQGNTDPVKVPFSERMVFPPLPQNTATVELDYLRNGGYTLYRATVPVLAGQTVLADPDEQPAAESASRFELTRDGDDFQVKLTKTLAGEVTEEPNFSIKGICYSPCPINVQGDGAPNIGDFFFDPRVNETTGETEFFNWYGLWGKGSLGDGFFARQDLDKIRDLGANSIRVYSMMSRQQGIKDVDPVEFPDPNSVYHFQHEQFLDQCWNNGVNPVYVIVGIPMPADNLYLNLQANTDKIEFYDFVLRETIADIANHPAVLGFTTQNEINNGPDAYPNGSGGQMIADQTNTGAQTARSDFFWGKIKEYSDYSKATAPDKLVGIAVHDFREIAQYASNFPNPGPTYLEQAANLDFVGVNTYQTENYNEQYTKGWGSLTGASRKALLFTELGFPATTRDGTDPATIKDTAESRQKTGEAVARMLPQAYADPVSIGACYFEFSDEWWKQEEDKDPATGDLRVDRWYGTPANPVTFPNGYWDEEGFGLFSIARYPGLENNDPVLVKVNGFDIGPDRHLDRLTERTEITSKVKQVFDNL